MRADSTATVSNTNCCVYGCRSRASRETNLSFHRFPQAGLQKVNVKNDLGEIEKLDRRLAWKRAINTLGPAVSNGNVSNAIKICSKHFQKDDYILPDVPCLRRRLKLNAVPSLNLPKLETQKESEIGGDPPIENSNDETQKEPDISGNLPIENKNPQKDKMETAELNKICRTCLSDNIDLQPLFDDVLSEMIMACSQVQIVAGDGLPETICTQCINLLNDAFKFKQQCENADRQLRNIFDVKSNDELQIKIEVVENCIDGDHNVDNELIDDKIIDMQDTAKNCNEDQKETICIVYNEIQDKPKRGRPKRSGTIKKSKRIQNKSGTGKDNAKSSKTFQSSSKCYVCTQTLVNCTQATHEINCHQAGKHACLSCKKLFGELRHLKQHLRVHRLERNYVCETCNKAFYGANDLMIHMRIHTGEKPLNCTVCSKAFSDPRGLNSHMKTHTGDKPYECAICNKRFAHSFVLSTHMRTHTAERPYVCSVCGKTFIYAHNLAIHARSHSGERPYPCTECDKAFSSSSTLSAHMMTHTGEKRFVCSVCGKKVARSGDLAIHMRSHTGEKPYACTICSKRYRMSCHLTSHMRTHTGEKNFVCDLCGRAFGDARVLKSHMTTHTGERPHSCETCKKTFAHYSALCSHRKTHLKKNLSSNTNTENSNEQNNVAS